MAKRKPKGLGDTLENIFEQTGVKAVVKFIAGDDCGCEERKIKLNKLFPYRKTNCLYENEYEYLKEFFSKKHRSDINPSEQTALLVIYNRVFNAQEQPTQCGSCWRDYLNELNKVYENYI
jgi:hypothetical protein